MITYVLTLLIAVISISNHTLTSLNEYWRAPPWHASIPSIPGHNTSGREFLRTHGNHLETQSHYNPQGRLMVQTTLKQQQANPGRPLDPISQRHYHYNTQGQLSQIDDRHKGQTHYHYDPLDRLTHVQGPHPETVVFDPAHNLLAIHGEQTADAPTQETEHTAQISDSFTIRQDSPCKSVHKPTTAQIL